MKILLDFLPIFLFFIAYKQYDIYVATAVIIVASVAQTAYIYFTEKRIPGMLLASTALIVLFGGATLLLQDETFIKWKPTIINWIFAVVFVGSLYIGKKPLLTRMMGEAFPALPLDIWKRLTWMWATFFVSVGIINLYVAFQYDTDTWVNFKLIGLLGLTFAFILLQSFYMMMLNSRYATETENTNTEAKPE